MIHLSAFIIKLFYTLIHIPEGLCNYTLKLSPKISLSKLFSLSWGFVVLSLLFWGFPLNSHLLWKKSHHHWKDLGCRVAIQSCFGIDLECKRWGLVRCLVFNGKFLLDLSGLVLVDVVTEFVVDNYICGDDIFLFYYRIFSTWAVALQTARHRRRRSTFNIFVCNNWIINRCLLSWVLRRNDKTFTRIRQYWKGLLR